MLFYLAQTVSEKNEPLKINLFHICMYIFEQLDHMATLDLQC